MLTGVTCSSGHLGYAAGVYCEFPWTFHSHLPLFHVHVFSEICVTEISTHSACDFFSSYWYIKPSFHGQFKFDEDKLFVTETLAMSLRSHTAKITYITQLAHLCHRYLTMTLRNGIEFPRAYFSPTNLLCQRKIVRGNQAL